MPRSGELRVWRHKLEYDERFYVNVKTLREAIFILDTLDDYEDYLGVACNAGLECFHEGEWRQWYDADKDTIRRYAISTDGRLVKFSPDVEDYDLRLEALDEMAELNQEMGFYD